jgi:hypothetical protein
MGNQSSKNQSSDRSLFPLKNEAAICLSPPADAEPQPTHTTAEVDTDRRSGELNANSERESRYFSAILRPRR